MEYKIINRNRLLNITHLLLGSCVMAILNGLYYLLFKYSFSNSLLSFLSAIIVFIMYRLAKIDRFTQLISFVFSGFLVFVLLPVAWFTTYGSKGPMTFYSMLFLVIISILSSQKHTYFLSFMIIAEILILWFFEKFYGEWLYTISSTYNAQNNLMTHYISSSLILALFMYINKKNTIEHQVKLAKYSMTDELTGLYNRRYFHDRLNAFYQERQRNGKQFEVLMMDIDNFKYINDHYGHNVGDEVLVNVASMIKTNIREYDVPCRYGGDEFVVILSDSDEVTVEHIKSRLLKEMELLSQKYPNARLGLSIGRSSGMKDTPEQILNSADKNLYEVKAEHKNQTEQITNPL